jgi:hypothetical protein
MVHQRENLHKLTCLQLDTVLNEFRLNSSDEETIVLTQLLSISNILGYEFHSSLRNELNYSAASSMNDHFGLGKEFRDDLGRNFLNKLLYSNYDTKVENRIQASSYFVIYLLNMILRLYDDYSQRCNFGKEFRQERENILHRNAIEIPRLINYFFRYFNFRLSIWNIKTS